MTTKFVMWLTERFESGYSDASGNSVSWLLISSCRCLWGPVKSDNMRVAVGDRSSTRLYVFDSTFEAQEGRHSGQGPSVRYATTTNKETWTL